MTKASGDMLATHAVGIDLGTTYSCLAYLNEHGEPVTIPNADGELSTPSVVMFDGDQIIVGTEALRNSIRSPDRVVMHSKRYLGDPHKSWTIAGRRFTPVDIASHVLRRLLDDAEARIGKVERAVITVPAQFSDLQRQATIEAGHKAGLKQIDVINEPVAAALCFVLGTEGIWFNELAASQTIMVVDLGGGTFDLSLVKYQQDSVSVIASGGDLHLGGIDWSKLLEKAIARQFQKEFGVDPLADRESQQALALEVEQAKRSLSVRSKAALTCQHAGHRKTFQVELEQFEKLSQPLVNQMETLTKGLLTENKMGWARVDVVLTTGGASRMPMVRQMLKTLSGRTLNSTLSPDQSIAQGATYYAGMLLTNNQFAKSILSDTAAARLRRFKQQSATARALGILVRDEATGSKVPHYLLPPNTQLPAEARQVVGTVIPHQKRAHLSIVESGTAADRQFLLLGDCIVEPLPPDLPENTEIEVTIRYDEQARVHVSAKVLSTGQVAHTEIVRPENLLVSAISESKTGDPATADGVSSSQPVYAPVTAMNPPPAAIADELDTRILAKPAIPSAEVSLPSAPAAKPTGASSKPRIPSALSGSMVVEDADHPIPLCNTCGEPLNSKRKCVLCDSPSGLVKPPAKNDRSLTERKDSSQEIRNSSLSRAQRKAASKQASKPPTGESKPPSRPPQDAAKSPAKKSPVEELMGEDEFFRLIQEE